MSGSTGVENLIELDHEQIVGKSRLSTVTKIKPDLRIEHVSKSFQSKNGSVSVLEDINLEIKQGEFVCLVGPSGCGKTTLMNIVAGLEKADSGEVWANGLKVNCAGPDRVVIFQEAALFPLAECGKKMLNLV